VYVNPSKSVVFSCHFRAIGTMTVKLSLMKVSIRDLGALQYTALGLELINKEVTFVGLLG
jgi:hypothetical protein